MGLPRVVQYFLVQCTAFENSTVDEVFPTDIQKILDENVYQKFDNYINSRLQEFNVPLTV